MILQIIPSNTATATLRRVSFSLLDATDLVTPEDISVTGVKVTYSIAGGSTATSTNDIVKVSGTVGEYYIEFTQAEINQTAGLVIRGWLQPSGCGLVKIAVQIGASTEFGTQPVNVTQWNGTNVASPATAGYPVVTIKVGTGTGEINAAGGKVPATIAVGDIANNALNAAALATDAVTEIQSGLATASGVTSATSGLATASALATVDTVVDSILVDTTAIKAKTDDLSFTGSLVNANMEAINTENLTGDGTEGNEFDVA